MMNLLSGESYIYILRNTCFRLFRSIVLIVIVCYYVFFFQFYVFKYLLIYLCILFV